LPPPPRKKEGKRGGRREWAFFFLIKGSEGATRSFSASEEKGKEDPFLLEAFEEASAASSYYYPGRGEEDAGHLQSRIGLHEISSSVVRLRRGKKREEGVGRPVHLLSMGGKMGHFSFFFRRVALEKKGRKGGGREP